MRVLFCESSWNLGGQELQILLQMAHLERAGERCVLACRPGSAIAHEATTRGLAWRPVPFRNSLHLPSIAALRALLRDERIQAAVSHSGHDTSCVALAARLLGATRPLLIRVRTYQSGVPKSVTYNRLVDRTLVNSEYLKRRILANAAIRPERVAVLRPMVPIATIRSDACRALPASLASACRGGGPVIVQAAMLRPEKGHRIALEAVAGLRRRYPQLRYVLAGSGAEEAALRQHAKRLGVEAAVHFAGLVMPVAPLLARADLVIMPSLDEPLGLAQLEALALGVPVVVSDAGGLPETVVDGETGWIVPAGDPLALAERMAAVLDDPRRAREMARRGSRFVEAAYAPATHLAALRSEIAKARAALAPRKGEPEAAADEERPAQPRNQPHPLARK